MHPSQSWVRGRNWTTARRINRREKLFLAQKDIELLCMHGTSLSFPANIDKDSCGVGTSLHLPAVTYWIMHSQYIALINFNLKHQFCAETSFSLPLILRGPETRSVMIGYKGAAEWTPPHSMCHKTCVTNQKPPWSLTTNEKPAESL